MSSRVYTSSSGSMNGNNGITILPPIGSDSATSALAAADAGISTSAAAAYRSFPSDLSNSLSKVTPIDRALMSEQRRKAVRNTLGGNNNSASGANTYASSDSSINNPAGTTSGSTGGKVPEFTAFRTGMSSLSFGHTRTHSNVVAFPPRIPTPLPQVLPIQSMMSNTEEGMNIHLNLPASNQRSVTGSMSAPGTSRTMTAAPTSSLATLTQDSNNRLASFLDQYEGTKRDSLSGRGNSDSNTSMRLLLYGLVRLSARELEEEKEVSRKLLSWHPARCHKQVAQVQHKIKSIIAERTALLDGSSAGKPLMEDERAREELPKRGSSLFKIQLPPHVGILKLDVEVSEGRVEMYVSAGEVVNQLNYARQKHRCWSLRAGVGHNTLTISSSDSNFRAGEEYFIAFFALTPSSFMIKPTFGGKGKSAPAASIPANTNLQQTSAASPSAATVAAGNGASNPVSNALSFTDVSDLISPLSAGTGPASSTSRLTARQQASLGMPSVRNLRKSLDARIKVLQDNPKARAEFQAKVSRMRKHGVAALPGADRPNSINPPAHLTLHQLQRLNEQEASMEAQRAAEEARNTAIPGSSTRGGGGRRQQQQQSVEETNTASPRTMGRSLSPVAHPVALTPHSLDVIPHIQAIAGVSQLFFDTARSIRHPTPLLDEHDRIIMDDLATHTVVQTHSSSSEEAGTHSSSESKERDSAPASPRSSQQTQQTPHTHIRPSLDRHSSLSTSLETLLQRVFKKLRVQSAQLLLLGQHPKNVQQTNSQFTHGHRTHSNSHSSHGANSPRDISPHSASPPTHSPRGTIGSMSWSDEEISNAHDEAHFINRCLTIYQAHRGEIEQILFAHASGDRSIPHIARLLPPAQGGNMSDGRDKNFLLVNAYQATDNKAYEPRLAEKRRRTWAEAHNARMLHAEEEHNRVLDAKRNATLAIIEKKENTRAAAIAFKQAQEQQKILADWQRKWLLYIQGALLHKYLRNWAVNLKPMKIELFRQSFAAKRIQKFIKPALMLRRKSRAQVYFQAFRSLMLTAAYNYSVVKKDRAATCIKVFISQKKGVNSVSRLIKNYRRRVGICQKRTRDWLDTKTLKLDIWRKQIKETISRCDIQMQELIDCNFGTMATEQILLAHFSECKKNAVQRWGSYEVALAEWKIQERDEKSKASILVDHIIQLPPKPNAPHVPVCIHNTQELIEKIIQKTKDFAREQLQNTTAEHTNLQLPMTNPSGSARPVSTRNDGGGSGGNSVNGSISIKSPRSGLQRNTLSVDMAHNGRPISGRRSAPKGR
jgi:hypothetical protein